MEAQPTGLAQIHSTKGWITTLSLFAVFAVLLPVLHLAVDESSALHVPSYLVQLLGKFLCYAIVAVAIDMIWGFTGILSLGHGVFFALGGYCMGMYLARSIGREGVYKSDLPDFMVFLDWKELPWYWLGFDSFPFAMFMALFIPGLLALIFGFFAFRSRIKGVYFSIITQAMTFALMLLFFRNDTGFGGNNGLTDFKTIVGYRVSDPGTKVALYIITCSVLLLTYLMCRFLLNGKLGRVLRGIRDVEGKVMFMGYNPLSYKLFAWTLSAVLCGLAGALYVPQVGIINPSEMEPANSIEMAIWVAVGGRASLSGAVLGAGLVNGLKSVFTVIAPDAWLYVLGALFILVTLYLPEGIVGLSAKLRKAEES